MKVFPLAGVLAISACSLCGAAESSAQEVERAPASDAQVVKQSDGAVPASTKKPEKIELIVKRVKAHEILLPGGEQNPVFVEFENSKTLTENMQKALVEKGFVVTNERDKAKTVMSVIGIAYLFGGPKFYRGKKVDLGEMTEETMKQAQSQDNRALTTHMNATTLPGASLNAALATQSAFQSSLLGAANIYLLAFNIAEMTGLSGWGNTMLVGDPRGVCLNRCENWNKVKQLVSIVVKTTGAGDDQEMQINGMVVQEEFALDQVIAGVFDLVVKGIQRSDVKA